MHKVTVKCHVMLKKKNSIVVVLYIILPTVKILKYNGAEVHNLKEEF